MRHYLSTLAWSGLLGIGALIGTPAFAGSISNSLSATPMADGQTWNLSCGAVACRGKFEPAVLVHKSSDSGGGGVQLIRDVRSVGWRGNYRRGGWHGARAVGWRGDHWRGGWHGARAVGWRGDNWRGGWHGARAVGWRNNYWRGGWHGIGGAGWRGNYWNNDNWGGGGFFGFGLPLFGASANTYYATPVAATPVMTTAHVAWCFGRFRSYSAADNTFQPFNGPRVQCVSPF